MEPCMRIGTVCMDICPRGKTFGIQRHNCPTAVANSPLCKGVACNGKEPGNARRNHCQLIVQETCGAEPKGSPKTAFKYLGLLTPLAMIWPSNPLLPNGSLTASRIVARPLERTCFDPPQILRCGSSLGRMNRPLFPGMPVLMLGERSRGSHW
ncbi:hypothetical protein L209DRAFT_216045 [Thermothelomyces heterothallicus CBS 203.75]